MGEQPNPWNILQPQVAKSRHRGAKPSRRCELLGKISLLSLESLLSVERWPFHSAPPPLQRLEKEKKLTVQKRQFANMELFISALFPLTPPPRLVELSDSHSLRYSFFKALNRVWARSHLWYPFL